MSAVTGRICIGVNGGAAGHEGIARVGQRTLATGVAAHQGCPSALGAGYIDGRLIEKPHLVTEHLHGPSGPAGDGPSVGNAVAAQHRLVGRLHGHCAAVAVGGVGAHHAVLADFGTDHDDRATVLAGGRCRGVQGAGVDRTRAGRRKSDRAAAVVDAAGPDHTLVVDGLGEHVGGGLAGQHHFAGSDRPGIADRRLDSRRVAQHLSAHLEAHQAVAAEIQHRLPPGAQIDVSVIGDDGALVGHRAADEAHRAAGGRLDDAPVDHQTAVLAGRTLETVIARHEVAGAHPQGTGDQAAYVHPGTGAEDDARGIDEEHPPVGLDAAENLAGTLTEDAVEHGRGR